MGYMRFGVSGAVAVLALCFLGCESEQTTTTSRPIDSEEATAKVNQRVDAVLTGLSDATAQIDTTDSTKVATDGVNGALGNDRCGNSGSDSLATESTDTVDSIPTESTDKLSESLGRLRDEAKEHVFREELLETKDGNQVVYKMDPRDPEIPTSVHETRSHNQNDYVTSARVNWLTRHWFSWPLRRGASHW